MPATVRAARCPFASSSERKAPRPASLQRDAEEHAAVRPNRPAYLSFLHLAQRCIPIVEYPRVTQADSKRPGLERTQIVRTPASATDRQESLCGTLTLLSEPGAGSLYVLDQDEFVVGRAPEVDLSIHDIGLSRAHARFVRSGRQYFVEDLKSTNGTCVDGELITTSTLLAAGARIQLGRSTVLRFALQDHLEQQAARRVYEQSIRDPLTGVYNRRYLEERLSHEFIFAERHQTELAVILFDVDHFKRINDTLGHQAGDEMLQALGELLKDGALAEDVVARYGGEEFVLVGPGLGLPEAKRRAEAIRSALEATRLPAKDGCYAATLSAGVACLGEGRYESVHALMAAADRALYQAKSAGRNRVVAAAETRA